MKNSIDHSIPSMGGLPDPSLDASTFSTMQMLFRQFPLPMFHYSLRQHRFVYFNISLREFFLRADPEFDPGRLEPQYVLALLRKFNSEESLAALRNDFAGGGIVTREICWPAEDGGMGAAMVRAIPMQGEDGQVDSLLGYLTDFTEEYRAVERRKRTERLHADLVQIASSFIQPSEGDFGRHLQNALRRMAESNNAENAILTLYSKDYQSVREFYHWSDSPVRITTHVIQKRPLAQFRWTARKLRREGYLRMNRLEDLPEEAAAEREIGRAVGVRSKLTVPILIEGRLNGSLGFENHREERYWDDETVAYCSIAGQILYNALEREHMLDLLRTSERKFRSLIDASIDWVWEIDAKCRFTYSSPHVADLLGYRVDEILGKCPFDFMPPEERISDELRAAISPVEFFHSREVRFIHKGGDVLIFEAKGMVIPDDSGGELGCRVIVHDITARKRTTELLNKERSRLETIVAEQTAELRVTNERLERAAQNKNQFLANMSHELRTPLATVIGIAEAMREGIAGSLTGRQSQFIQNIEESGRHLLSLLTDILDMSKIEAGRLSLMLEEVNIRSVGLTSLTFVRDTAAKKQIHLNFDAEHSLPRLLADPLRLKQILINLLTNAVKYTRRGGSVLLHVRHNQEERTVEFSVEDTGIGIPADMLPRIFEPFLQVHSSYQEKMEGSGLGLFLVKRLVELHKGFIRIESVVNAGSTFTVSLPVAAGAVSEWTSSAPVPELRSACLISDREESVGFWGPLAEAAGCAIVEMIPLLARDAEERFLRSRLPLAIIDVARATPRKSRAVVELFSNPAFATTAFLLRGNIPAHALPKRDRVSIIPGSAAPEEIPEAIRTLCRAEDPASTDTGGGHATPAKLQRDDRRRGKTVMVCDDHRPTVLLLESYLHSAGYSVVSAYNGEEGVALAGRASPDLILLDIQMPEMNGFDVITALRSEHRTRSIPIIALTALSLPEQRERATRLGADHYLLKPVKLSGLLDLIDRETGVTGRTGTAHPPTQPQER